MSDEHEPSKRTGPARRGATAATAIRPAALPGSSPELRLNLRTTWDLWHGYLG